MERKTIETLLKSLSLEGHTNLFKKNNLDLNLLLSLPEEELKEILLELDLPIGDRLKISKKMHELKNKEPIAQYGVKETSAEKHAKRENLDHHVEKANVKDIIGNFEKKANLGNPTPVPFKKNKEHIVDEDETKEEIRMVLIGKTGSGKSATGNTILGEKKFTASSSGSSVTHSCVQRYSIRFGQKLVIVDTPGIFDTKESNRKVQQEIFKCVGITAPGPHAFILVLSLTRYTDEERRTVEHFVKHFGDKIFKYFIVLFTRKDDLDDEGKSVSDHIQTVPEELQMFLRKCGSRVIAFNNKLKGEKQDEQVKQLLSMIHENIKHNNGDCYTNEMYEEAEALVKKRENEIIQQAKEKREKDQENIERKLAKEYKSKIEEEEMKLTDTQTSLDKLIKEIHEQEKAESDEDDDVKVCEKRLQRRQSMGMKREDLKKRLNGILKKKMALEKKQEEERLEMEHKAQEKFAKQKRNARNVVREEVEEEKGFFSWAWGRLKSFFS